MKKFKELEDQFKKSQEEEKNKIRAESKKCKRFWKWVWFVISFPWKWIWINIRDWHTALIFVIVMAVVSSEVWIPYLIGFICWNNEALRISMFSVGSVCWIFWLGPGTPFLIICIGLTIAIKGLFNKIKYGRKSKDGRAEEDE